MNNDGFRLQGYEPTGVWIDEYGFVDRSFDCECESAVVCEHDTNWNAKAPAPVAVNPYESVAGWGDFG